MKNPCINEDGTRCKQEYFRCRHICPFGIRYQMHKADERKRAKEARDKENAVDSFTIGRMIKQKGHGGIET
jgi:hypothetical protein